MRVLLVYNDYKFRGGEAVAFENERDLLRERGHEVIPFTRSNDETDRMAPLEVAGRMTWNPEAYSAARRAIREHRPDVVHCHNSFIVISPALYHAAAAEKVPVVQTLHNYRLLCPAATFFRDGHVCEDCLGRTVPWPGAWHGCYRDDRKTSAAVAGMLVAHRALGTWQRYIHRYIALTEFARDKYAEGGLPAHRLRVKPNFLRDDPGYGYHPDRDAPFALFIGRMAEEKGVRTLIEAWKHHHPGIGLKLAGEGPLEGELRAMSEGVDGVEFLGLQPRQQIFEWMRRATMLLFPSIWYECLPYSLVEAFAVGLPVMVSKLGSIASMIEDGHTGLHAEPGDPVDWADRVRRMAARPDELAAISTAARRQFDQRYTPDANGQRLEQIYREAIGPRSA